MSAEIVPVKHLFNKNLYLGGIEVAKRKILIAIIALTLSLQIGCTNGNKQNEGNNLDNGNKVEQEQNEDSKTDEKEIIAQLNEVVKDNENLSEAIEFINSNISKVSKETASQMVDILEKTQKANLTTIEDKYYEGEIQEKLFNMKKSVEELNKLEDINDEEIKELITETRSFGYKVETAEGAHFPIIDYSFLKKYSTYVTDDMKEYIEIMSIESDNVPAKDAAFMITWDEILNRALKHEKFINEYKDSTKLNDVKELYNKYVYFIFNGLDNTSLFDYPSNMMASEAKASYLAAIENKDNSELLKELSGFMEVLKGANYRLIDEVQKYREEAISRLSEEK